MKKLRLLILTSLITVVSFAQGKGSIVGHITDPNNLPIPGAVIKIESLNMMAVTDFNGDYTFVGIANGDYVLKSSCLGCKDLTQTVKVNGKTVVVNFVLDSAVNDLDEVVLKGSNSKGQAKALNKQKSNFNITNIVAADQVGKFPDANIGDAVKRIPGIAVQNDQGEARNIIIRGMSPQLNSVTLNGERIPSAEGDNRNVQMDLIPSDMVQAVEVNKVLTSDMEADAIGGSVNLVTRKAGEKTRITLTGAYGQNPVRNTPMYNAAAVLAGRVFNNKLGAVLSTSIQSNEFGSDNIEFEWTGDANNAVVSDQDIRKYDVTRVRQSVALNLDYKINNNNTLYFNTVLNNRKDWENRYRLQFKDIEETAPGVYKSEVRRQTKGGTNKNARLEEQQIKKYSLFGEHILFNSVKFNWKTNYSKASETRPDERYINYRLKDVEVTQDLSDTRFPGINPTGTDFNNPAALEFKEISEENQYTQEENYGAKFDIEIPMLQGDFENSLKVGYRYKNKEKSRDNTFSEYDPISAIDNMSDVAYSDQTVKGFLPGDKYKSGNFVDKEYLGGLDLKNSDLYIAKPVLEEFVPVNYNAKETVNAAYGMITQKLTPKLSALVGLRVERTDLDYTGYRIDIETAEDFDDATKIEASKNYTNFLPNLQFKYSLQPNTIFRLAYSTSIARPNYYDLVPYQNIDSSDDFVFEEGNSSLEASYSNNLDFMFEHYFSSVGIISGGVFYKNIDKFVYTYTEDGFVDAAYPGETFEYSQPRNGNQAKVYGVELSVQRRLDFLPKFLKNLNVYANYTYTDSEADGVEGRSKLALAGAVKNMFNASLAYETKKLTVRTSLNYAGAYIDEYGSEAFEDIYYDSQMFLDVNATYEIFKGLRLFTEFKNLTNQELRYYQGKKDLTAQAEYYNFNWNVGAKYNF